MSEGSQEAVNRTMKNINTQWPIASQVRFLVVAVAAFGASAFSLTGCGEDSAGATASQPASPDVTALPTIDPDLEVPPVVDTTVVLPSNPEQPALPPPPVELQGPPELVAFGPGVVITPLAATSSATANQGNNASKAIDGNESTRWESASVDNAWIQFDFGVKSQLGYMSLKWENAYGKEYAIQVSDDGSKWHQLRYVTAGKGGTEEFFNLNANVRFVRLQGVMRATQYGYSLFEVQFKSPGIDNSIARMGTAELPFPLDGRNLLSPGADPELESTQFKLADGTLITRFGFVGRSRHARERGEDWNEIGFGVNETVDGQGAPVNKGTGAHLNFVANYFKNRTWGVEIIDNSLVAGVSQPKLVMNQYYQQAQRGGGQSFFRRFDDPKVTGFGWMSPGDLLDDSTYTAGFSDIAACPVVSKPDNGKLLKPTTGYNGVIGANDGCSVVVNSYPRHSALVSNADGVLVPNGVTVGARPIKIGDIIEFTGSFFSTRAAMDAVGDSGAFRYYTNEVTYVVGQGLRPWYGVQPRLMNSPLPAETLQGGLGSVSYDYADNSAFMFQQPHTNVGMQNMQRFVEGRRWLHTNMWTGEHNEAGNDRNVEADKLQGPRFNQTTCVGCHINNGRSASPIAINQLLDTMVVRTASLSNGGKQIPHPLYGVAAQMHARSATTGKIQDWGTGVRVGSFDIKLVTLGDGTVVELSKPKLTFDGPTPDVFSLRSAQPMIGMGLLDAIPDEDILSRVRTTADADGVMGKANYAFDPETGAVRLGRYGWKASKVSLRHQAALALLSDMSVTSPVYPNRTCLAGATTCRSGLKELGISEDALRLITRYLGLLAVPAQRSMISGFPKGVTPLPHLNPNPASIAKGAKLFADMRCTACHVSEMKTGIRSELSEVRNQTIKPYTDMLLHDMGPELSDGFIEGQASGSMWRTPPLWGIGYTRSVGDKVAVGYLHDGRARTLTEAIVWHGGEGNASKNRFVALSKSDRQALLSFLESL